MKTGLALAIFFNLDREDLSDEEKALAIYTVMNMATHNSINKDYMLKAIKWLWHRQYEIIEDGEQEEPKKLTNFKKIKQMTVEEFAKLNNIELSFFGIANFIQETVDSDECEFCAYNENCKGADCMTCFDGIQEWLNQEAEQ